MNTETESGKQTSCSSLSQLGDAPGDDQHVSELHQLGGDEGAQL